MGLKEDSKKALAEKIADRIIKESKMVFLDLK